MGRRVIGGIEGRWYREWGHRGGIEGGFPPFLYIYSIRLYAMIILKILVIDADITIGHNFK
jgi:hypothetical protein